MSTSGKRSARIYVRVSGGGSVGERRVVSQQLSYVETKMSCHCNSQDALLFSIAARAAV